MRPFIGGLIGLVFGVLLVTLLALGLGLALASLISTLLGPVLPFLALLATSQTILTIIFVFAFGVIIANIFAYMLATAGLIGFFPTTISGALPVSPLEELARGFIIGLTAGINFGLWSLVPLPFALPLGIIVGLVGFLAVITLISRSLAYQMVLGWTSWLMPMSWLVQPLGILLFLINLPSALAAGGAGAVRFDATTCTLETTGGGPAGIRLGGSTSAAYNLGNFTFLTPALGGVPTPFIPAAGGGLSTHETGHTLTVAAFGGVFGWINAVDENLPPFRNGARAYGEMIPESHFPRPFPRHVRVWS